MSPGRVLFVGCGPGAPDLLTLRAVRALNAADIVIWSPTLLDRATLVEHARPDAQIVQWPPATGREIVDAFDRAQVEDLLVVRLKGGDPASFGALEPELSAARERGLRCELVPGVSTIAAAASALGCEIATAAAPMLLVDATTLGDAPLPDKATPAMVRLVVHAANRDPRGLQQVLLGRGLAAATPCVVAIEVSRPHEMLVSCTLDELAETIEDYGLGLLTLVVTGVEGPSDHRDAGPRTTGDPS